MRAVLAVLAAVALMLGGCSSDPVDGADNCTELAQVWVAGDQEDEEFLDQVIARAVELGGDALARGADGEALVCSKLADDANDYIFDQIMENL